MPASTQRRSNFMLLGLVIIIALLLLVLGG